MKVLVMLLVSKLLVIYMMNIHFFPGIDRNLEKNYW